MASRRVGGYMMLSASDSLLLRPLPPRLPLTASAQSVAFPPPPPGGGAGGKVLVLLGCWCGNKLALPLSMLLSLPLTSILLISACILVGASKLGCG